MSNEPCPCCGVLPREWYVRGCDIEEYERSGRISPEADRLRRYATRSEA
jgi:hypothetical protein